jgi:hypothetical protein
MVRGFDRLERLLRAVRPARRSSLDSITRSASCTAIGSPRSHSAPLPTSRHETPEAAATAALSSTGGWLSADRNPSRSSVDAVKADQLDVGAGRGFRGEAVREP